MYKKLVRSMLTLIFGTLVLTSLSLSVFSGSASAEAAKSGNEYTNTAGKHACLCEGGNECTPCGNLDEELQN